MEKQSKQEQPKSLMKKAAEIGIVGGLFWGGIWYFLHIFSFSEVGPSYLLKPFALGDWKKEIIGDIISIVIFGVLSIGIAMLYGALFKKFQGVIPGIIYGLLWWGLLFFVASFLSPVLKNIFKMPLPTIVTTLCIFILYGVFIAYSVSFEASEENYNKGAQGANYSNK